MFFSFLTTLFQATPTSKATTQISKQIQDLKENEGCLGLKHDSERNSDRARKLEARQNKKKKAIAQIGWWVKHVKETRSPRMNSFCCKGGSKNGKLVRIFMSVSVYNIQLSILCTVCSGENIHVLYCVQYTALCKLYTNYTKQIGS